MPSSMHTERYGRLCDLLIAKRKEAGLTQVAVADRLAKPQSFVSKYEKGERRIDLLEFLDISAAIEFDPVAVLRQFTES